MGRDPSCRQRSIGQIPDIIGMLAYINREALTDLLDRQITAKSDDRTALTLDQRQKQTSQTMDALFTVELDEATLTFQAWQDGLPKSNVKINPRLAVRNVVASPAKTGTSPEHAYDLVGPRRR